MENDDNMFAAWLDSTMRSRGISQAEMARAVGVADAQVSRWRRGQVVPTVRYLQQIAGVMGVQRATLDRLAGYPVGDAGAAEDTSDPALEAELAEQQARFARILRERVPRSMWRAYGDACESLAEGLSSSLKEMLEAATPDEKPSSQEPTNRPNMGFRR